MYHEVLEVVIQCGIVVLRPQELLCEGYHRVGIVPCGVILWIDIALEVAETLAIAVERTLDAQGHDETNLGNVRSDGGVEVEGLRDGTVGNGGLCCRGAVSTTIPADILVGLASTRHLGIAVVHAGKEGLIFALVVIVVAIKAQTGVQCLELFEVNHPL